MDQIVKMLLGQEEIMDDAQLPPSNQVWILPVLTTTSTP